jgi:hypothetical protein
MIYQVVMMSGKKISLESEEEVRSFLEQANKGMRLVLTKHGVINPASVDSIVPDNEANAAMKSLNGKPQDVLGTSPFVAILSGEKKMLN